MLLLHLLLWLLSYLRGALKIKYPHELALTLLLWDS
jgi:hypothetical protein